MNTSNLLKPVAASILILTMGTGISDEDQSTTDGADVTVYDDTKDYKEEAPDNANDTMNQSSSFTKADSNNDQRLSVKEAESRGLLEEKYSEYDTDGDGELDESEFSAFEETESGTR